MKNMVRFAVNSLLMTMMGKRLAVFILIFILGAETVYGKELNLTQAETDWLAAHKTIRVSGPQSFPPFQTVDSDGSHRGIASEYIQHIAKMVGLKVEFVEKQPWPSIINRIKNKKIDVLSCAAITEERKQYIDYTVPYLSFPLVIVSRTDAPFFDGIEALHTRKITFVEGNATFQWMKKEGIDFEAFFVKSPLAALKAVSHHKADAVIENLATASYLIERNGLTNLKIAAPTSYENYDLAIGVRKDWPELVAIFDKALAAIDQETHNDIRQTWISVQYDYGLRLSDVMKWAGVAGVVVTFLLLGFFLWNRTLKKEIWERKLAEQEKEQLIKTLTEALEEIRTLRGILPICSHCKKIRDDQGYWTKIESYICEHSEADFTHGICPGCVEELYGGQAWYNKKQFEK